MVNNKSPKDCARRIRFIGLIRDRFFFLMKVIFVFFFPLFSSSSFSSSSSEEEEDEEEDQREEESEEEEEEEDADSEYRHSQDDDGENFIREQNVKALRDGLPLSKIRYASVLSNLKPPEPDEVILKRHFAPLVPGGALQTGTFLVCLFVCFLLRAFGGGESILDS